MQTYVLYGTSCEYQNSLYLYLSVFKGKGICVYSKLHNNKFPLCPTLTILSAIRVCFPSQRIIAVKCKCMHQRLHQNVLNTLMLTIFTLMSHHLWSMARFTRT